MKTISKLLVVASFLLAFQAQAAEVMLVGTLMSYDAKVATIKQKNNITIRVPRQAVGDTSGYVTGKARVTVFTSPGELVALNPSMRK